MKPEPAPILRRQLATDPLHEAVGEVMHDATINLWRDWYQRIERVNDLHADLEATITALEEMVARSPSKSLNKTWFRSRLRKARASLETFG